MSECSVCCMSSSCRELNLRRLGAPGAMSMQRLTVSTRKTKYMKENNINQTVHIYVKVCAGASQPCFASISGQRATIVALKQMRNAAAENVSEDRGSKSPPKPQTEATERVGGSDSRSCISKDQAMAMLKVRRHCCFQDYPLTTSFCCHVRTNAGERGVAHVLATDAHRTSIQQESGSCS